MNSTQTDKNDTISPTSTSEIIDLSTYPGSQFSSPYDPGGESLSTEFSISPTDFTTTSLPHDSSMQYSEDFYSTDSLSNLGSGSTSIQGQTHGESDSLYDELDGLISTTIPLGTTSIDSTIAVLSTDFYDDMSTITYGMSEEVIDATQTFATTSSSMLYTTYFPLETSEPYVPETTVIITTSEAIGSLPSSGMEQEWISSTESMGISSSSADFDWDSLNVTITDSPDATTTTAGITTPPLITATKAPTENMGIPTSTMPSDLEHSTIIDGSALLPTLSSTVMLEPSASMDLNFTTEDSISTTDIDVDNATITVNYTDPCKDYCLNDADCISNSIEPICICGFKFIGPRCEMERKKLETLAFQGDSFISHTVPEELVNRVHIETEMATVVPEGIIMYTAVDKMYALIFLQKGQLSLHFSCGSQSMEFVETRSQVDDGYKFTLEFKLEMVLNGEDEWRCTGRVSVNNSYVMSGEQIVTNKSVVQQQRLQVVFFGGVQAQEESRAADNNALSSILPGFKGCMYELKVHYS